ncbi:DUF983 domain-containing protein [Roseomonas marmotae]|uniref:DUF983 domain-containing protein n=1 Tax=Roseomonas marmotae TaxID=2768161 RepID=A0ABS3KCR5_9PROT|nr:DUF983 domain-containing protein [Roseomonas marmotae]MBO1074792.1 DUF983 domain-containing protein [Roseomonas marmotae]QTI80699.1 DUF983 domain-containing protein [Roseomonas marmotae]
MTGSPPSVPLRRWQPDRSAGTASGAQPSFMTMIRRGARNRCPVCGEGRIFNGFLTLSPACGHCGAGFAHLRADDAPPYIVIFIVGHILVPPIFWVEKAWMPPMWLHMALWLPLFTIISTLMLRPVKGAVLGWMMRLGPLGDEAEMVVPGRTDSRDD